MQRAFFTFNPNGVNENHLNGYFVPNSGSEKYHRQNKHGVPSTMPYKKQPQPDNYRIGGLDTVHIKGPAYHHALPKVTQQRHTDFSKNHEPDKKVPILPLSFKTQF